MNQSVDVTLSYIGICTTDLERSARFYVNAFDFVLAHYVDIGPPFDRVAKLPGLKGRAGFFKRGETRIELITFENPRVSGSRERRAMNQLGLTHLSFVVRDLDATMKRITERGGSVRYETRVDVPAGALIFCTDPDGVRLELWQMERS